VNNFRRSILNFFSYNTTVEIYGKGRRDITSPWFYDKNVENLTKFLRKMKG
jgi:hypothetical protein